MKKVIFLLLNGSDNLTNNVVKALLIGFIVGFFIFLWDIGGYEVMWGFASGIIVAGVLFLKYNKKK